MRIPTPWWTRTLALFFIFLLLILGLVRYALTGLSMHFLVNPTLDCSNMETFDGQKVRFSSEHLQLTGLYFPPKQPRTPAVVICHGSGQTIRSTARIAYWLHQEGFATLTFDYRGFGGSQGHLRSFHDLSRDLQSAIFFLNRQKNIDTHTIGIMGLSLGTAPAVQAAASNRKVKALMLQGTIYSGEQLVFGIFPDPWVKFCAQYLVNLDGLNNEKSISRLQCPLLIIQEGEDDITLPQDGARLYERAREPKSYWFVPGVGHLDTIDRYPEEYRKKVTLFFKETLKK
ncbi:MAG TPA: alpha/beta fold hydrolase [Bacillota bacterium]|nr:alpha/beta fold hydrolase [Bacillota bacterium]